HIETDFSGNPSLRELAGQVGLQAERLSPASRGVWDGFAAVDSLELVLPAYFLRESALAHADPLGPEYYKSGLKLTWEFHHSAGLKLTLGGERRFYPPELLGQIAGHLHNLLSDMTAHPEKRVSELRMLSPEELQRITVEWNGAAIPYEERCIHEFFEDQAARTPDDVALVFKDRKMTYRELNVRANTLAHRLRDMGARPEAVVGVCMKRSMQAAVCILAVLKSGAAYTVIAPDSPAARVRDIVSLSCAKILLADAGHAPVFRGVGAEVLAVDVLSDAPESRNHPDNIDSGVTVDNAAYVLFTSGSTGKPKGVVGVHRSLAHLFGFGRFSYMTGPEHDVCCLNAPLDFLGAVSGLLMPLCCGVPLVIVPDGQEKDPHALADIIHRTGVTNLSTVPSLLKQLSTLGAKAERLLRSVRRVGLGGSVLDRGTIDAFRKTMPQAMMMVGYVSTEIGSVAFGHFVDLKKDGRRGPVPLGKPGPNVRAYILDRYMNPVPAGAPGELYIAADHLARGYAGQPELTGERFLPNPFDETPGKRFFQTGDILRFRPDGEVEYLGRADNQVKVRGFRVEPGEIESVLAACPGVDEAVVVKDEREESQRLVAYVVKKPGSEPGAEALREHLRQRLPWHMIPSAFFFLRQMPLTANGKVDRRGLSMNSLERPALENAYAPPEDGLQAELVEIWQTVLGVRHIGVHDEFLEIGGESLLAAVIAEKIAAWFSVEVSLPLFFSNLTVASLAEEISRLRAEA
ncbi:MAG: non-ribosomal peptide synthetase, partial [Acidobacteriota bacterium]|nr:non-ribosomal peptide synthetase [Acidobacteriota bacterium]